MAIDLFAGLGGWSDGLIAEGWDVIGFDIERHAYGEHRYPASLVIQDVLTLHGSQFRTADLIVCSPPCQEFSYMAMPWSVAKEKAARIRADETGAMLADLTRLFDACFRIQREACEAAGRHIPLVVENVRGAQPWVGRARWNFGSFYLWGDVPALMPVTFKGTKHDGSGWRENGTLLSNNRMVPSGGRKVGKDWGGGANVPGIGWTGFADTGASWRNREAAGVKQRGSGAAWFDDALNERRKAATAEVRKVGKDWGGGYGGGFGWDSSPMRRNNSKSNARKMASAMIAKIPLPLSTHIARVFKP